MSIRPVQSDLNHFFSCVRCLPAKEMAPESTMERQQAGGCSVMLCVMFCNLTKYPWDVLDKQLGLYQSIYQFTKTRSRCGLFILVYANEYFYINNFIHQSKMTVRVHLK